MGRKKKDVQKKEFQRKLALAIIELLGLLISLIKVIIDAFSD